VEAPPPLSRALNLTMGSAFGFTPGQFVDAALVLRALTPVLGPPTRDTGWYVTPYQPVPGVPEDCLGRNTQRILRWGNLSFAFWRYTGAGRPPYMLWSWTIGDTRASGEGDRREPHPIVERPAVAATTADGIGVGTPLSVLRSHFGAISVTGDGPAYLRGNDRGSHIDATIAHGKVTGIGTTLGFC
jgi:hypothetical protein